MTWDEIYRDHWKPLVAYARRRSVPGTDAEDVAASAMLRVWRQNHPPDLSSEVIRWNLMQSVRLYLQTPAGVSRRGGRSPRTNWGKRIPPPDWETVPADVRGDCSGWFPDDLPDDCRRVLTMAFEGRMSLSEIGDVCGKGTKWATAVYRRGIYRVARTLGMGGRPGNRQTTRP